MGFSAEVKAEELHRGVGSDVLQVPDVATLFPQHCDLPSGVQAGIAQEVLCFFEVVLGTEANDLDSVFVIESELLYVGGMAPASRSMRSPVPEQHRSVTRNDL